MKARRTKRYVLCLKNEGYPASLEVRKVYVALADLDAERRGLVRVVDESGEDYLYPTRYFVAVDLPAVAKRAISLSAWLI